MTLFRDFKEKDREIFLEFCSDFYRGDAVDHPISKAQMVTTFDEILRQGPYLRGLLFEQDREPAGYGQLSFTFSNEAGGFVVLIEELYVLPAFQGRGIGSAFLDWVKEEYRERAKRYRLEVCAGNTGAIRLYSRKGFERLRYEQMILEV